MKLIRALARPLLASVFIVDAIDALRHPEAHVEKLRPLEPAIEKTGDAVPGVPNDLTTLVRVHAGITLGAGILFALGKAQRTSASVLALAAAPAAILAHPVRTKAQRRENLPALVSRAAAIAGLSFAATDRRGAPSLGWRYRTWQDQRAEIARVKAAEN